jgi:hypothetical protein
MTQQELSINFSSFKDLDVTIKAHHSCGTFQNLCTAIQREHPNLLMRGVIMLHDSNQPHMACTVQETLCSTCSRALDHSPYSLGLSLHDFHEFCPLKSQRYQVCGGAVIPAAAQEVHYRRDPSTSVSMECLHQCSHKNYS